MLKTLESFVFVILCISDHACTCVVTVKSVSFVCYVEQLTILLNILFINL